MLLGNKCKGADRDLNYKGNKTARHLLLDTIAVDLLLCSISDTLRSWQSLCCCCCQKVLMATRNPHQPSVAHSWEHGCTNKFMIVSFGRHDRPARRLVFTNKTKTDINVLTVQFYREEADLDLAEASVFSINSTDCCLGWSCWKGFSPFIL